VHKLEEIINGHVKSIVKQNYTRFSFLSSLMTEKVIENISFLLFFVIFAKDKSKNKMDTGSFLLSKVLYSVLNYFI
jgi:hypothetical protein